MMEVSRVVKVEDLGKKEEQEPVEQQEDNGDEIELSLELSIGRKSYKKSNPLPKISMGFNDSSSGTKMGVLENCAEDNYHQMSGFSRPHVKYTDPATDPQAKRGIQALRRQEARKKREEKLKTKAVSRGKNGGSVCSVNGDKEKRESYHEDDGADDESEPPRKKEKNETFGGNGEEEDDDDDDEAMAKDLKLTLHHGFNAVCQMPYPYRPPAMHYVPLTNGFVCPYGVVAQPCWGPVAAAPVANKGPEKEKSINFCNGSEGPEKEKKVSFEPAACRSFWPYNGNNWNLEQTGNGKSDGSSGGGPNAGSDFQSSSYHGGKSNDTGSSSSNFPRENLNASSAGNERDEKSEKKCCFKGIESNEVKDNTAANHSLSLCTPRSKCSQEPRPEEPILTSQGPIPPITSKEEPSSGITTKPPNPQIECQGASSLPQMPCVSTTGNGPNGRTITGFLYRYTKTEVSIVCVCHGTTFSPAEFVKHAGGVDIDNPLRHITVLPSALV